MSKLVITENANKRFTVRIGEDGPIIFPNVLYKEAAKKYSDKLIIFDEPITAHILQSQGPIRISVVGHRPFTEQVFVTPTTDDGCVQWADTEDVIWHYPQVVAELERLRNIDKEIEGLQFLRGEAIREIAKKSEENIPAIIKAEN